MMKIVAQIPNAPVPYPTMYLCSRNVRLYAHFCYWIVLYLLDICPMHCGIWEMVRRQDPANIIWQLKEKWVELHYDIELRKCLSHIFCRVCKIKQILLVIHYTICGAVCFQFTHFHYDDWENIYILSYYHNQIGNMNYWPLFRVR